MRPTVSLLVVLDVAGLAASGRTTLVFGEGLNEPFAVALDGAGAIYVSDSENHRVIRIDS